MKQLTLIKFYLYREKPCAWDLWDNSKVSLLLCSAGIAPLFHFFFRHFDQPEHHKLRNPGFLKKAGSTEKKTFDDFEKNL